MNTDHTVEVTRCTATVDTSDLREHEHCLTDGREAVFFHVTHPAACDALRYGALCWFDDEWLHGGRTGEHLALPAGTYTAVPATDPQRPGITFTPATDPTAAARRGTERDTPRR